MVDEILPDFKLWLIEKIISKYAADIYHLRKPSGDLSFGSSPVQLNGRHFIVERESHDENSVRKSKDNVPIALYSKRRKEANTAVMCVLCHASNCTTR